MIDRMAAEADILRCGYDLGFFDKPDIERWAERQIEAIEEPPLALIDLAMIRSASPVDVVNLLRQLGSTDPAASLATQLAFIGMLYQSQRLPIQHAIAGLYSLARERGLTDEQRLAIYYLDDGYDLAVAGTYGAVQDIDRDLREFVLPYTEKLKSDYPDLIPDNE